MKRAFISAMLASVALGAARAEPFDLEARKARLPWLWEVPQPSPPPEAPGTTEIDRFLADTLRAKGLTPAPPADDLTWLRRAHFALIGLPPTPADLDAFLADEPAHRRERRVDALLASPHFGERWARHWMDLVRYAESRGHEEDFTIANAWRYRDWLVRAFNADVPYDQFVREHLAGDLIPPRLGPHGENESVQATGWAFLGEEVHNPVDIRQDECERIDNKVDVLGKTFLGLTIGCARCHDHKFDAISQQDYYALCGFLLGSGYRQARFETMEREKATAAALATLRARFEPAVRRELAGSFARVAPSLSVRLREPELQGVRTDLPARPSSAPERLPTAGLVADWTRPGATPWKTDGPTFGTAPSAASSLLFAAGDGALTGVATATCARRDAFWNRLALAPRTEMDAGLLGSAGRAGRTLLTPKFTLASGRLHLLLRGRASFYAGVDSHLMLTGGLHNALRAEFDTGGEWRWITHDLGGYIGHRLHVELAPRDDSPLEVAMVIDAANGPTWLPFSPKPPADAEAELRALETDVSALAACWSTGKDAPAELLPLADWLVRHRTALGVPEPAALAEWRSETAALAAGERWESATAVALGDLTGVDDRVLKRGKPTSPAEPAPRGLPAAFGFPRATDTDSSGRLTLAAQVASAENPLTARVMVNRLWHHVFGRGLVATVDNFGWLGDRPSHPALLDHLAFQFSHGDGWSVKRMLRRLVLTDAFARSSTPADGRTAELDPDDVFLHRMPVRRLEAEAVRDSLLVLSGRFDPALGGPPVPVHLTEFIVGRGRPGRSGPLDGAGRRSLYTAVRRNFLPTTLLAFDFPTPFSTVGRRNVTNVPAQALVMMNDPLVHEQAALWAARLLRETPDAPDEERVARLFTAAYARTATAAEMDATRAALEDFRRLQPAAPPLTHWSALCHSLLGASEFTHLR